MPLAGESYTPQQPITQGLKEIIVTNDYKALFKEANRAVSNQQILELDQFYYYVDALVTWIPEIRNWEWHGIMC